MPNPASVRQAFRTGITANTANADLLRALRRPWRDGDDTIADLAEAMRYVLQTPAAAINDDRWRQAWNLVVPALPTLPATGAGSVRAIRNQLRALLADIASPQWLKDNCQRLKRTLKIDTNAQNEAVYDQQNTDPCVVAADAAVVTIAAANSTVEQLRDADAALSLWRELSPE